MNKEGDGKITENPAGDEKNFKGSGIEGVKSPEATKEEKKAKKEALKAERKARHKALSRELGRLRGEHKRLLAKEEKAGFVDGHLVSARAERLRRIDNCEAEVKALGKKR